MKKLLFIFLFILFICSCKKENTTSFISQYNSMCGTWFPESVSYDSSGIKLTKSLPYNKLLIKENLEYVIFNIDNAIENGSINIIHQTHDKLILFFDAQYSTTSSYAGSHIFGVTNVRLISLTNNQMIMQTINAGYAQYSDKKFTFTR